MAATLCFDFGNTRKKMAVFQGQELKEIIVLPDDSVATIQSLLDRFQPTKTILSSVVEHNPGDRKPAGIQNKVPPA
jgi:type III pantothenate kinase